MSLSSNRIILLSLIDISYQKGWIGITKLHKLSFLTDFYLSLENQRAFSYEFFMYDHGPISKGVYDDFEFLLDSGLLTEDETGIKPSIEGVLIAQNSRAIIPENINDTMQSVAEKFAGLETKELVNWVHEMEIEIEKGKVKRINEIKKGTTIIPGTVESPLKLNSELKETLEIMSNKELINKVREHRKKGSLSKPYVPLLSS